MRAFDSAGSARSPGLAWQLSAAFISLLAVWVRLAFWREAFSPQGVIPYDVDACYHLWRAEQLSETWPAVPRFDPFISFPHGAPVPWPAGFDLILALPGLLGLGREALDVWAASLMPCLGGIAAYLVCRLGARLFGEVAGLVSGFVYALMKGAAVYSLVGRTDHHVMVPVVMLSSFMAFLVGMASPSRNRQIAWGVMSGGLAGLSVSLWIVTPPLYFLPIPASLFALRFLAGKDRICWIGGSTLVSAGVVAFALAVLEGDMKHRPLVLYQPSLFVAMPYVAAALVLVPLMRSWRVFVASSALVIAVGFFTARQWIPILSEAFRVAAIDDPSYLMAAESRPLFMTEGGPDARLAIEFFSTLIFLAPLGLGIYAVKVFSLKDRFEERLFFLFYACLAYGLLLIQRRFAEYAAPALALSYGWMLATGVDVIRRYVAECAVKSRAYCLSCILIVAMGWALYPLPKGVLDLRKSHIYDHPSSLFVFGKRLEHSLPRSTDPSSIPAEGLLTSWANSHVLLYAMKRPVMVSSFGTPEALEGNRIAFQILLSPDEDTVVRRLEALRVRYIVVSPMLSKSGMEAMCAMAGIPQVFVNVERSETGTVVRPTPEFYRSLHGRLYVGDGLAMGSHQGRMRPLTRMRLIAESEDARDARPDTRATFKAFELVQGARLTGNARWAKAVTLSASICTHTGRRFVYRSESSVSPDGHFEFVVPYSTEGGPRLAGPKEAYQIEAGPFQTAIQVTESDIQEGRNIEVRWNEEGP